jgi:hypothetical protein
MAAELSYFANPRVSIKPLAGSITVQAALM